MDVKEQRYLTELWFDLEEAASDDPKWWLPMAVA